MKSHITLLIFILFTFKGIAQLDTIQLETTRLVKSEIAIGLTVPWDLVWGPDDHIWATERWGTVLRINPSTGLTIRVLDIINQVTADQESGLLGMALHPDFLNSPYVYIVYVYDDTWPYTERLARYEWNGSELVDEVVLLDDLPASTIHNGSRLLITEDNKLLMTTGDVGNSDLSQDMSSLMGKLLRLNLDGSIPDDNPDPSSYIYSYGHRNSQGLAIGPGGQIYASEHGAQSSDEFNIILGDRNYGWPAVQGACNTNAEMNFCQNNNVVEPLMEWSPCVAVNGLTYYDHDAIPEWKGKMLMAVLGGFVQQPRVSVLTFNGEGTQVVNEEQYFDQFGRIRDIIVSPDGAIYFATNGQFYPGSGPNMIVAYEPLVTSNTEDLDDQNSLINLYPNPASADQSITLEYDILLSGGTYKVIGYDGREADGGTLDVNANQIKIEGLPSGQYYVLIQSEAGSITKSFIVE